MVLVHIHVYTLVFLCGNWDCHYIQHGSIIIVCRTAANYSRRLVRQVQCSGDSHGRAAEWSDSGIAVTSLFTCEWAWLPSIFQQNFVEGQSSNNKLYTVVSISLYS